MPPALAAAGSQVAPIPTDCGKSGAWNGCPKPCTASTPKTAGMCSREFLIANRCMVLYSLAQSRPVLPVPPEPVVSTGMSVAPASIEPTLLSMKIFSSQTGFGRLKPPWLVQVLLVSVTCVTSIWTICPIFSDRVILSSRSLTRSSTERCWPRYAARPLAEPPAPTTTTDIRAAPASAPLRAANLTCPPPPPVWGWSRSVQPMFHPPSFAARGPARPNVTRDVDHPRADTGIQKGAGEPLPVSLGACARLRPRSQLNRRMRCMRRRHSRLRDLDSPAAGSKHSRVRQVAYAL